MKRILTVLLLVVGALLSQSPLHGEAAQYKIRYVLVHDPNSPLMVTALRFADMVRRETNGDLEVQVFPSGQYGGKSVGELEIAKLVSSGAIEMGQAATSSLSNVSDKLGVFDLPFLFRDYRHWDGVVDGPIGDRLLEGLLKHNIRGLAYNDVGQRIIPTTNLEFHRPEDLRGTKLRILESQVLIAVYRAWGVEPVPLPVREIVNTAKKGLIQGADRSYPTYWDFGQQEVFKVVNETYHAILPMIAFVNEPYFQSLPPAYQKIVLGAARRAAKLERIQFRGYVDEVQRLCRKQGIKIVKLTPEERKAFERAVEPVYRQYTSIFGADLIQSIKDHR